MTLLREGLGVRLKLRANNFSPKHPYNEKEIAVQSEPFQEEISSLSLALITLTVCVSFIRLLLNIKTKSYAI